MGMAPTAAVSDIHTRRSVELAELMVVVAEAVAADGGEVTLLATDLEAGTLSLELSGACSACSLTSATLEQGITRVLRQRLEWVTEIHTSVAKPTDIASAAALGRGGFSLRKDLTL
jgi:Fe-S cluster biogenesis protein NfuA